MFRNLNRVATSKSLRPTCPAPAVHVPEQYSPRPCRPSSYLQGSPSPVSVSSETHLDQGEDRGQSPRRLRVTTVDLAPVTQPHQHLYSMSQDDRPESTIVTPLTPQAKPAQVGAPPAIPNSHRGLGSMSPYKLLVLSIVKQPCKGLQLTLHSRNRKVSTTHSPSQLDSHHA